MGIFGKAFRMTLSKADDFFSSKNVRNKVRDKADDTFTNKGSMKTTSAVGEQGATRATAGGRKVATESVKKGMQGAGSTARVGGKVVAGTGIASIPALTGVGLYNYYKNSTALTDEDRRLDFLLDKAKEASDSGIDNSSGDPNVDGDPTARGNTGVGGNSPYGISGAGFNPFSEAYKDSGKHTESQTNPYLAIGGLLALGGIGYVAYKNYKK